MKKPKNYALFVKKKYKSMFFIGLMSNAFVYISELLDSILGGRFIGADAVSAISLVQPFYMFIIFAGGLISAGTDTLYSRAAGNFDQKKANAIFGQSLVVTLGISVIMTAVMVIFKQPLLNIYAAGNSANIMRLAGDYYDFYCLVAFFYPIQWLIFSIVFTDGGGKTAVAGDIANMLVNFAVSFILIGPMGIRGLGLGTFCGLLASILVMCVHFFTKSNSVGLGFQFKPKEILETVALGLSSSTSMLMGAIVDLVMNVYVINTVGYRFLPAYSIANMILNMALIFSNAGTASNPINSIYYGESNPDGNKKTMYVVTKYILIESSIVTLLVEAAGGILPSLYSITDPEVFAVSVFAVRVLGITLIPTALLLVYMMYYSTVGHNGLSMLLLTSYMLVLPLVLCITLGKIWGMCGIFASLALTPVISDLLCIAVMLVRYGKSEIPLLLGNRSHIKSWDIAVTENSISGLCDSLCTELEAFDTDRRTAAKARLAAEETCMMILERNNGKNVCLECTAFVKDDCVEIIIRDDGVISDVSKETDMPVSLREYVYKMLSGAMFCNSYIKTAAYNRYKCVITK